MPAPVAVWSGFEMLVWGGQEAGPTAAAVAGAYDPIADRLGAGHPSTATLGRAGVDRGTPLLGGRYDASADGLWRFRPPPPRPVGPVPPVLGAKRR